MNSWRPTALLARVLGISDGEALTLAVIAGVTVVLTAGGLPPVLRENHEQSESAAVSSPSNPPDTLRLEEPVNIGSEPFTAINRGPDIGGAELGEPLGSDWDAANVGRDEPPTSGDPGSVAPPPEHRCPSEGSVAPIEDVVAALDALTGGRIPDATITAAIAMAIGCRSADPTVLLIAALIEAGQAIPDPGLGPVEMPAVPYVEIPAPLIELVQPARPALDEFCALNSTLAVLTVLTGASYPPPVSDVLLQAPFLVASVCGQIQHLDANSRPAARAVEDPVQQVVLEVVVPAATMAVA